MIALGDLRNWCIVGGGGLGGMGNNRGLVGSVLIRHCLFVE